MRFGGIVVVVLLALGACSSDPEVREPPPSTSATPTATPPTMPAQARQDSPEGAAAFVKHYIDVFNFAARTGDVAELERLSSPTCEGCQSYIKLIADTYEQGQKIIGVNWKATKTEVDQIDHREVVFQDISSVESTGREAYRLYFELSEGSGRVVEKLERSDA